MDKSEGYIFSQLVGNKMAHADGLKVLSGQQKQQNVPAGRIIKVVAARPSWTMRCGFFKWGLRARGLGH